MITTYEKPSRAFIVQQYGWKPVFEAYRIKNYKMRLVKDIKTHSLRRVEKLVKLARPVHTSTGENWFKTEYELSKNILDYPNRVFTAAHTTANTLAHSARWHTNKNTHEQLCFGGPYVFQKQGGFLVHITSGWYVTTQDDRWGNCTDQLRWLISFLENNKHA